MQQQPLNQTQLTGPPNGHWRDGICDWGSNLWPSCCCVWGTNGIGGAWVVSQRKYFNIVILLVIFI